MILYFSRLDFKDIKKRQVFNNLTLQFDYKGITFLNNSDLKC